MNDLERNYYNAFVSVRDFGAASVADFKAGSAAAEMDRSGATQTSSARWQMTM